MKKSKRIKAMLLAGTLAVGMTVGSMNVMAASLQTGSINQNVSQDITKVLELPEGVSIPYGNLTFEYEITAVDGTGSDGLSYTTDVADKKSAATITLENSESNCIIFSSSDYNKSEWDQGEYKEREQPEPQNIRWNSDKKLYEISKSVNLNYGYDSSKNTGGFKHAGKYAYKITENAYTNNDESNDNYINKSNGEKVTYDPQVYCLYVYVAATDDIDGKTVVGKDNTGNSLVVNNVTLTKWNEDPSGNSTKQDDLTFNNMYSRYGNTTGEASNPDSSLVVTKRLTGSYANANEEFTFTMTFQKSGSYTELPESNNKKDYVTVTKKLADGNNDNGWENNGTKTLKIDSSGNIDSLTVTLQGNESLVFAGMPAGTRYTISESDFSDYTPSAVYVEDGVNGKNGTFTSGEKSFSVNADNDTLLVGEGANTVTVTNTKDSIPITGIVMNNLPFIILICVAGAGLVSYAVIRRKIAR